MQDLFGGSSGSSNNQQSSQSGFSLLPQQLQQAFTQYAGNLNNATSNPASLTAAFTPQDLNSGATSSLQALSDNAYAPTAANVQNSMNMQIDPYKQSVIDVINKNANGQNSALNSDVSAAGQFGSNRAMLGANDIGQTQANTLNSFLSGEYNTAMNNALTTIPQANETAAGLSIGAGQTQQQQALAKSTAPYTALSAYSQLLGAIPQSGGSTSQGSSSSQQSSNNGIMSLFGGNTIGNIGKAVGGISSLFA